MKPQKPTKKEVADALQEYNNWQRGGDGPMPNPTELGKTIDTAIEYLQEPCACKNKEAAPKQKDTKTITQFVRVDDNDWKMVLNHCRNTSNKKAADKEPTKEFKRRILMSEHTPIRDIVIAWRWENIPYWVAMEWARHKFEKYISSQTPQRSDNPTPREERRQDYPVTMDCVANAQNLIDAWRKRLCFKAQPKARELAEDFKMRLYELQPELADALVPNCIYRGGCPEMESCGFYNQYMDAFQTLQDKYCLYNDNFSFL